MTTETVHGPCAACGKKRMCRVGLCSPCGGWKRAAPGPKPTGEDRESPRVLDPDGWVTGPNGIKTYAGELLP